MCRKQRKENAHAVINSAWVFRFYATADNVHIPFTAMQSAIPITVGKAKLTAVHLRLFVSLYTVMQDVEQGKWNSTNITIHIAVTEVQPLDINKSFSADSSDISVSTVPSEYAIIIIGTTISFAGKPSMNASNITPSSPIILPNGSRNSVQCDNSEASPAVTFAISHIISPAGIATITALPRTNSVLSRNALTRTFANCGVLYGGSSSVNDDGIPFSNVFDRKRDESITAATEAAIAALSRSAAKNPSLRQPAHR